MNWVGVRGEISLRDEERREVNDIQRARSKVSETLVAMRLKSSICIGALDSWPWRYSYAIPGVYLWVKEKGESLHGWTDGLQGETDLARVLTSLLL